MSTRTTLRALSVLALTAFAAACGSGSDAPRVDTVIIEAPASDLAVGETMQLSAIAYDDDGDEINGRQVEWTSSNNAVATISSTGLLTGVAPGTVAITAKIGGQTDTQTFEVVNDQCPVTPYTIGATVNGALSTSDCALDDNTRFDLYSFTLTSTRTVTITMTSTQVDPYLFLLSSAGTVLGEDNNSGGGTNARITRQLTAGTYFIAANSFAVATGSYQLTSQ